MSKRIWVVIEIQLPVGYGGGSSIHAIQFCTGVLCGEISVNLSTEEQWIMPHIPLG